jgi:hypothetical protein
MTKPCADPICRRTFEPTCPQRKYCSPKCQMRAWRAKQSPERKASDKAHREEYSASHPQQVHENDLRQHAKSYRAGKVAPWMMT